MIQHPRSLVYRVRADNKQWDYFIFWQWFDIDSNKISDSGALKRAGSGNSERLLCVSVTYYNTPMLYCETVVHRVQAILGLQSIISFWQ